MKSRHSQSLNTFTLMLRPQVASSGENTQTAESIVVPNYTIRFTGLGDTDTFVM